MSFKSRLNKAETESKAQREQALALSRRWWAVVAAEGQTLRLRKTLGGWGEFPALAALLVHFRQTRPPAIRLGRRIRCRHPHPDVKGLTDDELVAMIVAAVDATLGYPAALRLAVDPANASDPDVAILVNALAPAEREAVLSLNKYKPTVETWETIEKIEERVPDLIEAVWQKMKDPAQATNAEMLSPSAVSR